MKLCEDKTILIEWKETVGINAIGAIISYILGVFIVPLVIAFSKKEGLVDLPNERRWCCNMAKYNANVFVLSFVKLLSLRKSFIRAVIRWFFNVPVRTNR